jgi:hypothetical protein
VEGIEPPLIALEAIVIPLDHTPVVLIMAILLPAGKIRTSPIPSPILGEECKELFLRFFGVIGVLAALGAMLAQGQLMAVLAP